MSNNMHCPNCRYHEPISDITGECRRYAPRPNSSVYVTKGIVGEIRNDIHWPKVYGSNWCGDFVPKTGM